VRDRVIRAAVPIILVAGGAFAFWLDLNADSGTAGTTLATIGTAVGTIGLAVYTYQLARSTRQSVEGSDEQLNELRAQRDLLVEQAEALKDQAPAAIELAAASKSQVDQAFKTRIDSYSPMVGVRVELVTARYLMGNGEIELHEGMPVIDDQDNQYPVSVKLRFIYQNYGRSPALLSFGDIAGQMEKVSSAFTNRVVLEPGGQYDDVLDVRGSLEEFMDGRQVNVTVTCNGLLHREMFDAIRWFGYIHPFDVNRRVVARQADMLNPGDPQIHRDYPNLDDPKSEPVN
jgi:hypothetical protein